VRPTSAKKLDEDLDTLWASKVGNVDLSKWSKDKVNFRPCNSFVDRKYKTAHFQNFIKIEN